MSPDLYSQYADRWRFVGVSLVALIALCLAMFFAPSRIARILGSAVLAPLVFVPWGLMCMCVWFHPTKGNLGPSARIFGRLPKIVQSGLRWYAAAFLTLFIVIAAVVLPLVALFGR